MKRSPARGRQCGDDQQHGVRPGRPGLEQLILGDDEILPQHGHIHGSADRLQIKERAVEERRLGEHGNRGGARRCVAAGNRRGIDRSRPGRSTPRDGDRRLHSAITLTRSVSRERGTEGARLPAFGPRLNHRDRLALLATATTRRVAATIVWSRIGPVGCASGPAHVMGIGSRAGCSAVEIDTISAQATRPASPRSIASRRARDAVLHR